MSTEGVVLLGDFGDENPWTNEFGEQIIIRDVVCSAVKSACAGSGVSLSYGIALGDNFYPHGIQVGFFEGVDLGVGMTFSSM